MSITYTRYLRFHLFSWFQELRGLGVRVRDVLYVGKPSLTTTDVRRTVDPLQWWRCKGLDTIMSVGHVGGGGEVNFG